MPFFDRIDELAALEDHWRRPGASFFIVWGRRRVGKTELLSHFAQGRRSFYFEATDTTERNQLHALSRELAVATGNPLYRQAPLPGWDAALTALADFARSEPTLVVLDEFQYLATRQRELPTLLNRWWRATGSTLPLMLVLAGSEVSFFRDEVLAGRMYGRRTGQLALKPFDAASAALFVPGYSPEDKVRTYAVCGGMPYYLQAFDDRVRLGENILRHILHRDGFLHEEAELLLRQELADPLNHVAVLEAVARGHTRTSQIANATGLGSSQASQVLRTLERLDLVEQRRPVTAGPSSKKTSWAILDGFLNFTFRFVEPYRSRLRTRDEARRHLEGTVLPQLDHFVSRPAWEAICLEYMKREEEAARAGAWWGKVRTEARRTEELEVDGVAVDADGRITALASCKWTNAPLDRGEDVFLTRMEQHIPGAGEGGRHYLFSRSGFDPRLIELAAADPDRYRLVTPQDLLRVVGREDLPGRPTRRLPRPMAEITEQTQHTRTASYLAEKGEVHRVLLLYSGGLDTSVMLKWIQDEYDAEVVTLTVNLGQPGEDYEVVEGKARDLGAVDTFVVDAREEFAHEYVLPAIKANGLYGGGYPLFTALGRPLIAKLAVEHARRVGCDTIAHGCTGKGNDQVRIEATVATLAPELKVIAPVRGWQMGREEEMEYARRNGIHVKGPSEGAPPYSIDDNLWGRSSEGRWIEELDHAPEDDVFQLVTPPERAPDETQVVEVTFEQGVPVALDGERLELVALLDRVAEMGCRHGVGIVDHIEDRIVGLKVRDIYEVPAATIVLLAHRELEKLVCTIHQNQFKADLDRQWAYLVYAGLWWEPLRGDLDAYMERVNEQVTGTIGIKLYKGSARVVTRQSPNAVYDEALASFTASGGLFSQQASPGFIELWSLQSRMAWRLRNDPPT